MYLLATCRIAGLHLIGMRFFLFSSDVRNTDDTARLPPPEVEWRQIFAVASAQALVPNRFNRRQAPGREFVVLPGSLRLKEIDIADAKFL